MLVRQRGPLPWYHVHHHEGVGVEDGGESLRQGYLCLELNFVVLRKMFVSAEFGQI